MTRRVITNFRARDFTGAEAELPPSRPKTDEELEAEFAANRAAYESEEVPVGTSAEIQDWVGDDQARAQRALDKENANSNPRKGLVKHLEGMLAGEETE